MSASVSTHVLDTGRGQPATGVLVELYRGDEIVAAGVTDGDGRLSLAANLEPAVYRLVFHPASSAFFSRVEIEFVIDEAGKNVHVPLLVSPYSCTTYRGS